MGEYSISSILVKEKGMVQKSVYFMRKQLQGPETRYAEIEKAALAVMITTHKLRPYFLSHLIKVRTNLPFKQMLGRPDLSGRMVKWAVGRVSIK